MAAPGFEFSLEEFRAAAASGQPTPAAVAIAAVSASFALGLLAKVAQVSSRRKKFADHAVRLNSIALTADAGSKRMLQLAEEDVAAFRAHMAAQRLPQSTEPERYARERAVDRTTHAAIDIPLAAARAAANGLDLCAEATAATHAAVLADLSAAAALLASAMRIFLTCADSNLRQFAADEAPFHSALAERTEWETKAYRQADAVLKHVASALNSLAAESGANT